jgi:hypothetical protein
VVSTATASVSWTSEATTWLTGRVTTSSKSASCPGNSATQLSTLGGWSRWTLAWGLPYTAASGNRPVPPACSTPLPVSTARRTGSPSSSRAAANGPYWSGVISVSMTVTPSASTTAPALGRPRPGGSVSHA